MNVISIENIITSTWEQYFGHDGVIEGAWDSDLALSFEVVISVDNYGYEKDGATHHPEWVRSYYQEFTIIVTPRHQVFVWDGKMGEQGAVWVNTSNHDVCWRSDGLHCIQESLLAGYEHCWSHVPQEHQLAPNQMNTHCSVNDNSKSPVQFVRISTKPTDQGRRTITSIRPVSFTVKFRSNWK